MVCIVTDEINFGTKFTFHEYPYRRAGLNSSFYKVQRVQMMNDLSQYITGIPRLSHILYGNDALSETYNKYIFIIVHKFIKDTERFKN